MTQKKTNIVWGLFFMFAGVFTIMNAAGAFEGVDLLRTAVTLMMIPVVVVSIIDVNFWGIFYPFAIVGIMYDKELGIEELSPFPLLLTAAFFSLGMSMIVPKRSAAGLASAAAGGSPDTDVYFRTRLGKQVKSLPNGILRSLTIDAFCSDLKVYFNNAQLAGGHGDLLFSCTVSSIELYVPRSWQVIAASDCAVGEIDEKGYVNAPKSEQVLMLHGTAKATGVTVIYV